MYIEVLCNSTRVYWHHISSLESRTHLNVLRYYALYVVMMGAVAIKGDAVALVRQHQGGKILFIMQQIQGPSFVLGILSVNADHYVIIDDLEEIKQAAIAYKGKYLKDGVFGIINS